MNDRLRSATVHDLPVIVQLNVVEILDVLPMVSYAWSGANFVATVARDAAAREQSYEALADKRKQGSPRQQAAKAARAKGSK